MEHEGIKATRPITCSNCGKKIKIGYLYYLTRGVGNLCPKCQEQRLKMLD